MNKRLLLALFLLFVITALNGCQTKTTNQGHLTVREVGLSDAVDGGNHSSDFPLWSVENLTYHEDASAPRQISVTINGERVVGTYKRSCVWMPNTFVSHQYVNDTYTFEINADTMELVFYRVVRPPLPKATMSKEECRTIADSWAETYIDLNEYKVSQSSSPFEENAYYGFVYYREIDGYQTGDSINVVVDGNGNLSSARWQTLGAFRNIEHIDIGREDLERAVEAKLDIIYPKLSVKRDYVIKDIIWIRLDDGSMACFVTVDVRLIRGDLSTGARINLLIQ